MTQYRRSYDGTTIHKPGCRWYARSSRWVIGDRASEDEIRALAARHPWLRLCRICWADA